MTNPTESLLGTLEPELVERIVSRRDAVTDLGKKVGIAAIASAPVMLGVMARSAFGQTSTLPQAVLDILNFALKLEYLESTFYNAGLSSTNPNAVAAANRTVITQIAKHENAHVALLKATIGSTAIPLPGIDLTAHGTFPDVLTNPVTYLAVAQAFEDTGVRAYKGQAGNILAAGSLDILTVALRIHSVEARHASEIRKLRNVKSWITGNGQSQTVAAAYPNYAGEDNLMQLTVNASTLPGATVDGATEAFDEPLTMAQVLALVTPFFT
jgi:rubrerythrin